MQNALLAVWGLFSFLLLFLTFFAIILSIFLKDKARYYVVNTALSLGSIAYILINCVIFLPLPEEVKQKIGAPREERLKQAAAEIETTEVIHELQKENSILSYFSNWSYPLVKPSMTIDKAKKSLAKLIEDYPYVESYRTAYALALRYTSDDVNLANKVPSKVCEFRQSIFPVFEDPANVDDESLEAFEEVVLKELPAGWFQNEGKLLLDKLTGIQKYGYDVKRIRDEASRRLLPVIWIYSLSCLVFSIWGIFLLCSFLKRPEFLWANKKEENEIFNGRMVLSVALISGYVVLFLSLWGGLLELFLSKLFASAINMFVLFLSAGLVTIISTRLLITGPAKVKFRDAFILRMSFSQLPSVVKYALEGVALGAFLCALAWLVLFNVFGGVDSINPINWQMEALAKSKDYVSLALNILSIVVLAPIFEELFFRGLIYGWLRSKFKVLPAIIVSAMIFAGYHLDFQMFPVLTALGIALAFTYERSKTLTSSIFLHAIWNAWYVLSMQFIR